MKKRKSGRKKINWTEAFKYYCTSVNGRYPSYADVASKYNVNKNTVWKAAQKEEWIKHRQNADERGKYKFLEDKTKAVSILERESFKNLTTIEEALITTFENKANSDNLRINDIKSTAQSLLMLINAKRVILGLPTSVKSAEVKISEIAIEFPVEEAKKIDKYLLTLQESRKVS